MKNLNLQKEEKPMSMTYGRVTKAKDDQDQEYLLSGELGIPEVDGILLYGWENYIVENFCKPYSVSLLNLEKDTNLPTSDSLFKYLGASLFPTKSESEPSVDDKHFFGSVKYKDEILYFLLAGKEVTQVDFFDRYDAKIEKGSVENLEKGKYKLVWFRESHKNLPHVFNVMNIGLNDIEMPYRNLPNYMELINHEPIAVSEQKNHNIIYDNLTGTVLANKPVEKTILLDHVKRLNSSNTWNPRNTYRRGEEVDWTLNGEKITFISLKDWNIGERPGLSRFWQNKDDDFEFLLEKHKFKIEVYDDSGNEIKEYPAHLSFRTYVNISKLNPTITFEDGFFLAEVKGECIDTIDIDSILKKSVESYINGSRTISLEINRKSDKSDIGEITLVFLKKALRVDDNWMKPYAVAHKGADYSTDIGSDHLNDYKNSFTLPVDLKSLGFNIKSVGKAINMHYKDKSFRYNYSFEYTDWDIDMVDAKLIIRDTYDIPFTYEYLVYFGSSISASFNGYKGFFLDYISKEIESGKDTVFKLMPIKEGTIPNIRVDQETEILIPGKFIQSEGDTIGLNNINSEGIYTLVIKSGAQKNHTFEVI